MRPTLLASTLFTVLAMNANAADTRLTIYSGDFDAVAASEPAPGAPGFALVRERREHELRAGAQVLTISGLPEAIDAAGARFVAQGEARVTGQRFDFALADQRELLRRALGQRVTVEQAVGTERATYTGTLLAAGDGLTLALDDGRVKVLSSYTGFELAALPEGLYARPTLRFDVEAGRAGRQAFVLDYPTGGLAWRAEYVASLRGDGGDCRMDFSGAAQIANRSGAGFAAAAVSLVAGEPRRAAPGPMPRGEVMMMAKAQVADAAPVPEASGEYHAYALPGRTDLPHGSVQRVPLVTPATGVRCTRRYETARSMPGFHPSQPILHADFGPTGVQPVQAMLAFDNDEAAGLGVPLPAGRLRVFDAGRDEEAFLGEVVLPHTAAGRTVDVALGDAFDLSLERTRESFALDPDRQGATETLRLALRNAKPGGATVRVLESLPRWSDWTLEESSVPGRKIDAQTVAFDVPVPARGEATVRYRVRYRWPASVTPPGP